MKNMSTMLCIVFVLFTYCTVIQLTTLKSFHTERSRIRFHIDLTFELTQLYSNVKKTFYKNNESPQEVYKIVLEESGGALHASSMSKEPRNLKQA